MNSAMASYILGSHSMGHTCAYMELQLQCGMEHGVGELAKIGIKEPVFSSGSYQRTQDHLANDCQQSQLLLVRLCDCYL